MKQAVRETLRSFGTKPRWRKPVARARGIAERFLELTGPPKSERPWDRSFRHWIEKARQQGRDPNDVGDEQWSSPMASLEKYYFPLFNRSATVFELGPGSGRYTRHIVGRCKELIVADYSLAVCDWCREYFASHPIRVIHCTDYQLAEIGDDSVDAIIANGVFEHVYPEGTLQYLRTFRRILKREGRGCFNYDNLMSKEGFAKFLNELPRGLDDRNIFRFYHPGVIAKFVREAGLEVDRMDISDSRMAFVTFIRRT
jgi:ubiquinone/menaquinone biosynthesis C-methylase UbiE